MCKNSMNGESIAAPAPWANAMVADALVRPLNRRAGAADK
jgi:hypothetical protein